MKSHVSMEQHVCPVCGTTFDTGSILLHKRLANTLEPHTVTGQSLCPEHKAKRDEGYVALIGVTADPNVDKTARRTGEIVHVRASVWPQLFVGVAVPSQGFCYVEVAFIEKLKEMQA